MMRFADGRWAMAGGVAAHALAWPSTAVMPAATAVYRLPAERARQKTLVALSTHAPGSTIAIMERGPGGPAMGVKVDDGPRTLTVEAWRGR